MRESCERGEGGEEGVLIDDVEKAAPRRSEGTLPKLAAPNPNGRTPYPTQPR